jgi:urease accessory protein
VDITIMDDAALYQLMSWLSPAFPVGAFSYSHGLEYAVEAGLVTDEATLEAWLLACLNEELGNVGGAMLRAAYEAAAGRNLPCLAQALEEARAMMPTPEFELEARAQGTAFVTTLRAAWPVALTDFEKILAEGWVPYGSAVGIAGAAAGLPLRPILIGYFQSVMSNLLSAGIRLIPLGQTAGQRILARLLAATLSAAERVLSRSAGDIGAAMPMIDWGSMQHETQYTRLFRS